MNRYDWIVVGMCLYGIYLIVQGLLSAISIAATSALTSVEVLGMSGTREAGFLMAFATSFIGSCLVFGSMKIGLATSKKVGNEAYSPSGRTHA